MKKLLILGLAVGLVGLSGTGYTDVIYDKKNTGFHTPGTYIGGTEIKSIEIDLNGDEKTEKISIVDISKGQEHTAYDNFVLHVGEASVKNRLNNGMTDGFTIIDINKDDNYKEIAIHTGGPSDDHEYIIYWYDGKFIKEMGHFTVYCVSGEME